MTRALTFPDCDANPCAFGLLITLFYDILKWQPCSATKGHWTRKFGSRGKIGLIWPRHMYQIIAPTDKKNSLLVLKKALCTHFRLLKRREWYRTRCLVIMGIIIKLREYTSPQTFGDFRASSEPRKSPETQEKMHSQNELQN